MARISQRNGQSQNPKTVAKDRTGLTTAPGSYHSLEKITTLCDDSEIERIDDIDREEVEERAGEVDADCPDPEEMDDGENSGIDDDSDMDPFYEGPYSPVSWYRPVWLWRGGRLLWCDIGRGEDPFSLERERFRMLTEYITLHFFKNFPELRPDSMGKGEITPAEANGLIREAWFGKNVIDRFSRMAIAIPGGNQPIFPISAFFGDGRGGGVPLRWEEKWLRSQLKRHGCPDLLKGRVSLERGSDRGWIYGEYLRFVEDLREFAIEAVNLSGLELKGDIFKMEMSLKTFQKKKIPVWKKAMKKAIKKGERR